MPFLKSPNRNHSQIKMCPCLIVMQSNYDPIIYYTHIDFIVNIGPFGFISFVATHLTILRLSYWYTVGLGSVLVSELLDFNTNITLSFNKNNFISLTRDQVKHNGI